MAIKTIKPVKKSQLVALLNAKKPKSTTARKGIGKVSRTERSDWLKTALNLAMEAGQELWEDPVNYFRVSGLGDPCIRSMVMSALGHRVPFEAKKLRIFAVGTLIGQVIADTLEKGGNLIEAEGEVILEDPPIKGHFDVLIKSLDEEFLDEEFMGEVKSINDYAFDKLPEEHDFTVASLSPLIQSYKSYIIQWNTYAILKGDLRGFIIFESKNTQRHKIFWLEPDRELFDECIDKVKVGVPYLLEQRIPPVPAERNPYGGDSVCTKCDRRYLCEIAPKDGMALADLIKLDKQVRG